VYVDLGRSGRLVIFCLFEEYKCLNNDTESYDPMIGWVVEL
jgi:hypothetical protein